MPGVYISYPFCSQKCTYCNFASGVMPAQLEAIYLDALLAEIAAHSWRWKPDTVYLGGGTPSRLSPQDLERLLAAIPGRPWHEATIEAAPGSITAGLASAWRDAGITRVSLGVQSFSNEELRLSGRRHTAEVVAAELALLRDAGLNDCNLDLIAGLPAQTLDSWRDSLAWIARLQPAHVSVYMLEVDSDSRLGGELISGGSRYSASRVPNDAQIAEMYELAVEQLARLGIHRYEISNFSRPGRESLHNLKYWRGLPYAGFGADAHSSDEGIRRRNADDVAAYIRSVGESGSACVEQTPASPIEERFFLGLRLMEGVRPEPADWSIHHDAIHRFLDAGLLERSGDVLRLTSRGVMLSNEVFQEFLVS